MARKNTLVYQVAENQSLSSSFSSAPTVVRYLDNCSYQINVSTTDSVGTFVVEASNDYYVNEGNASVVENEGNWVALTLAGGVPFVAASDDKIIINLNQLPFYAIRISYVSGTPGTGTCSIFITDKQIGG